MHRVKGGEHLDDTAFFTEQALRKWLWELRAFGERDSRMPAGTENGWQDAAAAITAQRARVIQALRQHGDPAAEFPVLYTGLRTDAPERIAQFDAMLRVFPREITGADCKPYYQGMGIRFQAGGADCVLTPFFVIRGGGADSGAQLFSLDALDVQPDEMRAALAGSKCGFGCWIAPEVYGRLAELIETAPTRTAFGSVCRLFDLVSACGGAKAARECRTMRSTMSKESEHLRQTALAALVQEMRQLFAKCLADYREAEALLAGDAEANDPALIGRADALLRAIGQSLAWENGRKDFYQYYGLADLRPRLQMLAGYYDAVDKICMITAELDRMRANEPVISRRREDAVHITELWEQLTEADKALLVCQEEKNVDSMRAYLARLIQYTAALGRLHDREICRNNDMLRDLVTVLERLVLFRDSEALLAEAKRLIRKNQKEWLQKHGLWTMFPE